MNLPPLPSFVFLPSGDLFAALRSKQHPGGGATLTGYAADPKRRVPQRLSIELDGDCVVKAAAPRDALRQLAEAWLSEAVLGEQELLALLDSVDRVVDVQDGIFDAEGKPA